MFYVLFYQDSDKVIDTSISELNNVFTHHDELMFVLPSDVSLMQAVPQTPVTDRGIY